MAADFADRYGPWGLVAGGSEGLGAAWSEALARRGVNVMMVARRSRPLDAHAELLRRRYGVQVSTRTVDLSRPGAHTDLVSVCADNELGIVIYNAALSPSGSFATMDPEMIAASIATNVVTPTLVLRALLPQLRERHHSGVVLVSSLAGFAGSAGLATYGATKAYLRMLAEALWEECRDSGVDVLATAPGAVSTPGLAGRSARRIPGQLDPDRIAESSLRRLGRSPVHVPGWVNLMAATALARVLPRPTATAVMRRSSSGIVAGP